MDKKRVLFSVILGSLAIVAFAQRASDFRTARNTTGGLPGITILGYHGDIDDVTIPSYIDGTPVTVIGEKAFYRAGITSVHIPETVTTIRREAFAGNDLRTITLPRTTPTIDASAFDPSAAAALAESAQAAYAAQDKRESRAAASTRPSEPVKSVPRAAPPARPKTTSVYVRNEVPMLRVEVNPPSDYEDDYYYEEEETPPPPPVRPRQMRRRTTAASPKPEAAPSEPVKESEESAPLVAQTQIVPDHNDSQNTPSYAVILPPGMAPLYPDIHYQVVQVPAANQQNAAPQQNAAVQPFAQPNAYSINGTPPNTIPVVSQSGPPSGAQMGNFTASSPYGAYGISDYIDTRDYIVTANIGRRTGTGSITGWRGNESSIEIPSTIDGVVITEIGSAVFSARRLVEVYLPPTIVTIGEAAFNGNNLSFIDLPPSVRSIGAQAFAGNPITEINIGANVTIQPDTFGSAFYAIYNDSGRLAGRYVVNRSTWTMLYQTGAVYY